MVEVFSNALFTDPTYEFMASFHDTGSHTYVFQFNYPSLAPYLLGCHCIELPFVFGNFEKWDNAPMLENMSMEEARHLSDQIQGYFLGYIKNGIPEHEGSIDWPI
ncbi:carboxylesterase family protein [Bacillus cereus]|nr:carboxylesterase family protein [Bacillus cereus]